MPKNKVSEWSATPANNTDIGGINIAEGCAPSGINNAIRELMAQVKDMQSGSDADNFTLGGTLTANSSVGSSGQLLSSRGAGLSPQWVSSGFVTGMIVMWSGTIATIPSGWLLCNGSNGTPDLRNRFVIGAHSDTSSLAQTTITGAATKTGGSKDAIVVSHTHTGTTVSAGNHNHTFQVQPNAPSGSSGTPASGDGVGIARNTASAGDHTHTFTTASTGSDGTNANLVPYFALAYIMKA